MRTCNYALDVVKKGKALLSILVQNHVEMTTKVQEILTPRLRLRRFQQSDLDALHIILSQPDTAKYMSSPAHTTLAETQRFLTSSIKAFAKGESDEFVIEILPESGIEPELEPEATLWSRLFPPTTTKIQEPRSIVVGKLGCWKFPEIGYFIHEDYHQQGIFSEAFSAFLSYIWKAQPQLDRLFADADPRNVPSIKALQKFGFEVTGYEQGTMTTHLGICDSLYLELKRPSGIVSVSFFCGEEMIANCVNLVSKSIHNFYIMYIIC